MKKILITLCLILFVSCEGSERKTEDYENNFYREQAERFINMKLGEDTWMYQVHIIRMPGGWIIAGNGVSFIPYTIVYEELKESGEW